MFNTQPLSHLNSTYNAKCFCTIKSDKVQEVNELYALIQLTISIPDKGSPS